MSIRYKRTDWVRRLEGFSSGCSSGFRLGQCLIASILAIFTGISRLLPVTRCLSVTISKSWRGVPSCAVPSGVEAYHGRWRPFTNWLFDSPMPVVVGASSLKSSAWREKWELHPIFATLMRKMTTTFLLTVILCTAFLSYPVAHAADAPLKTPSYYELQQNGSSEELGRAKYILTQRAILLEKQSASIEDDIKDIEWWNTTIKGVVDLYNLGAHVTGKDPIFGKFKDFEINSTSKHLETIGKVFDKLPPKARDALLKPLDNNKDVLFKGFAHMGMILEWSTKSGSFDENPAFNSGNFNLVSNNFKENKHYQGYLELMDVTNQNVPIESRVFSAFALKFGADLLQSSGTLGVGYIVTNIIQIATDFMSASYALDVTRKADATFAAIDFVEYYFIAYKGSRTGFYKALEISKDAPLEKAFSAFLEKRGTYECTKAVDNFTSWGCLMDTALNGPGGFDEEKAISSIRNLLKEPFLALRLNAKPDKEEDYVLGNEFTMEPELYSDSILYQEGYRLAVNSVQVTGLDNELTHDKGIYTVPMDPIGTAQFEVDYTLRDPSGAEYQDKLTFDFPINIDVNDLESNKIELDYSKVYQKYADYYVKLVFGLPSAMFTTEKTGFELRPSSSNRVKFSLDYYDPYSERTRTETQWLSSEKDTIEFDVLFDRRNDKAVWEKKGLIGDFTLTMELFNSYILPDGKATETYLYSVNYADLKDTDSIPYLEIYTKDGSFNMNQGDEFKLCLPNFSIFPNEFQWEEDPNQWEGAVLYYSYQQNDTEMGDSRIIVDKIENDCMQFIAQETALYSIGGIFGLWDEQEIPVYTGKMVRVYKDDKGLVVGDVDTPAKPHFKQVSVSSQKSCALNSDGGIECWGRNGAGELFPPYGRFTQASIGYSMGCALKKDDGKLVCWGTPHSDLPLSEKDFGDDSFTQVSVSNSRICALKTDGIVCWSWDYSLEKLIPTSHPGNFTQLDTHNHEICAVKGDGGIECWNGREAPEGNNFTQVSIHSDYSCALKNDGSIFCWGDENRWWGQASTPKGNNFIQVSAGGAQSCALKDDGSIVCWGDSRSKFNSPPTVGIFSQISASSNHVCAVTTNGDISCWENYDYDNSNFDDGSIPPLENNITSISLQGGNHHNCILKTDKSIDCWGSNEYGQPTPPLGIFTQMDTAVHNTCAVRSNGKIACWGNNDYGQNTPPEGIFTQVSVGGDTICALEMDESIKCWGRKDLYGQANPPDGNFIHISAGRYGACAVKKSDGAIICWGSEQYNSQSNDEVDFTHVSTGAWWNDSVTICGIMKSNDNLRCWGRANNLNRPFDQTLDGNFTQVSVDKNDSRACAIKSDGNLACWRVFNWIPDNGYKPPLGKLTPPKGNFTQVTASHSNACAVRTDNHLVCWGDIARGLHAEDFSEEPINESNAANRITQITAITPTEVILGEEIIYTVTGSNLTDDMGFTVGDCAPSSQELPGGTNSQRKFKCTQYGDPGTKYGLVKNHPSGTVLHEFTVEAKKQALANPPIITDISPKTTVIGEEVTITITGSNLIDGMGFSIYDCAPSSNELEGGNSTQRQFKCTQSGKPGSKSVLIKDQPNGYLLENFVVTATSPALEVPALEVPVISKVTPLTSTINELVIFTVTGTNLTKGMGFTVAECENSNYELSGGTSTQRQFQCTQYGSPGSKRGLVKDAPGGQVLYEFTVEAREVDSEGEQPILGNGMIIYDDWTSQLDTEAIFVGGTAVNNEPAVQHVTIDQTDTVSIQGSVRINPAHVGMEGDLISVAGYTTDEVTLFFMQNQKGQFLPWEIDLSSLVGRSPLKPLSEVEIIDIYNNPLTGLHGIVQVYFGYRVDNMIIINHIPDGIMSISIR